VNVAIKKRKGQLDYKQPKRSLTHLPKKFITIRLAYYNKAIRIIEL